VVFFAFDCDRSGRARTTEGGNSEGGEVKMRKLFALMMLTLVIAAVGCGGSQPAAEAPATETAPMEETAPMDTTMHMDTTATAH
jgi:hypothetical protein